MSIIILTSFFVLTLGILYYSSVRLFNRKTPTIFTTSSTVKSYKTIHIDTNGNGKKDTMNINIDYNKKEYSIEIINDNGKRYSLFLHRTQLLAPSYPGGRCKSLFLM
jgi:archaellum component FlaF (FlaF/FlaG flagellin family)